MLRHAASSSNRRVFLLLVTAFLVPLAISTAVSLIARASDDPAPIELRLPAGIVYEKIVGADSAVTFSHETHVALADNRCTGCHPRPFRMLRPTHRARHSEMNAGASCGQCHDGQHAFGVRDPAACGSCHSGRISKPVAAKGDTAATAAPARKLPKAYRFTGSQDSPGPVSFRHETHMKGKTRCVACHPKPFGMKAPAGGMAMHAACGSCHDGKRSFGVEDMEKCNRCHAGGQ